MGDRRIVAMVFADVVDSTALLIRMGEQRGEELRSTLSAAHRTATLGAGGTVVKDLGDGVMAMFGNVSDAVAGSIALQCATSDVARRLKVPELAIRVGLSLGEATSDQPIDGGPLDWHGRPVIEAARLCAAAAPHQILASDTSLLFATGVDRVSVGALTLKGLPEPVSASAVAWAMTETGTFALPTAIAPAMRRFVGRDSHVDELRRAWKEASIGASRLALISGEPGIGKTRLASEIARGAHSEGALVLFGRNDESGVIPHQPFVEVLRQALAAFPDEDRPFGLGRLLPEFADAHGSSDDPELSRLTAYDATAAVLRTVSARAPVLLILDDMHWATPGTIALARHLRSGLTESSILSVLTYRDTDVDRKVPFGALLTDLHRVDEVTRIRLTGIDQTAIKQLLAETFGEAATPDLVARLALQTEGNAFFVGAILDHFAETGAAIGTTLPEGVRDVIGRRLDRVGPDIVSVLTTAAVIGAQFDVQLLADVHGGSPDGVFDAVDAAVTARLVCDGDRAGRIVFAHALIRQTLLDELASTRRARLHQRVAAVLTGRSNVSDEDLADHLLAAVPIVAFDEAATVARRVIEATVSPSDAMHMVERVLALADDVHAAPTIDLAEIAGAGAFALFQLTERQRARSYIRRAIAIAEAIGDDDLYIRFVGLLNAVAEFGVDPEQEELLDRIRGRILPDSPKDRLLRANEILRLSMAGSPTDPTAEARTIGNWAGHPMEHFFPMAAAASMHSSSSADECLGFGRKLLGLLPHLGDHSVFPVGLAMVRLGLLDELRGLCNEIHASWRRTSRQSDGFIVAYQQEAILHLLRGELDAARDAVGAVARTAGDDLMYLAGCAMQTVAIQVLEGDLASALQTLESFRGLTPQPRWEVASAGIVRLRAGDLDGARRDFDEAWTDGISSLTYDWARAATLAHLAELAVGLADRDRSAALYDELLPWDNQLLISMCTHVVCSSNYALGTLAATLGHRDEARQRLVGALAWEESLGATPLADRTSTFLATLNTAP